MSAPDDPKPWRTLDSKYLYRKPWLTLRQDRAQLPSGAVVEEYFVWEYPPWVNVLAVTPERQVVLIRQYRYALGEVHYELPAGTADGAEDPESAARRELLEETGYGGGRWSLWMTLSANPALQNNLTYTYLAEDVTLQRPPALEATEDLIVRLVPAAAVRDLVLDGGVVQALHAAPLLKYAIREAGV